MFLSPHLFVVRENEDAVSHSPPVTRLAARLALTGVIDRCEIDWANKTFFKQLTRFSSFFLGALVVGNRTHASCPFQTHTTTTPIHLAAVMLDYSVSINIRKTETPGRGMLYPLSSSTNESTMVALDLDDGKSSSSPPSGVLLLLLRDSFHRRLHLLPSSAFPTL